MLTEDGMRDSEGDGFMRGWREIVTRDRIAAQHSGKRQQGRQHHKRWQQEMAIRDGMQYIAGLQCYLEKIWLRLSSFIVLFLQDQLLCLLHSKKQCDIHKLLHLVE